MSNCESIFNEVEEQHKEHKSADFSDVYDRKNKDEDLGKFEKLSEAQP